MIALLNISYERINVGYAPPPTWNVRANDSNFDNSGLTPPNKGICQIQNERTMEETPLRLSLEWTQGNTDVLDCLSSVLCRVSPQNGSCVYAYSVWRMLVTKSWISITAGRGEILRMHRGGNLSMTIKYMGQESLEQRTESGEKAALATVVKQELHWPTLDTVRETIGWSGCQNAVLSPQRHRLGAADI